MLLSVLSLIGTFVFAISGAIAGIRRQLDIFGILVLSFVAANFGGVMRDLLIGSLPPDAIKQWPYLVVSLAAGLFAFYWTSLIAKLSNPVLVFDAAGLAIFAVTGTQKALDFGLNPIMSIILGMLTGIGGGLARDILLNEIPVVLRSDIYAVAALAGASVVVVGKLAHISVYFATILGAIICFTLRMLAIYHRWHLPTSKFYGRRRFQDGSPE